MARSSLTTGKSDEARRARLRRLRHAVRCAFGHAPLRSVLARQGGRALGSVALETARVHLAAQPHARLSPLLRGDARRAEAQLRSAGSAALLRADGRTDAGVPAPVAVPRCDASLARSRRQESHPL